MAKRKILVVDDRLNTLKVLMAILADEGYEVMQAANGAQALEVAGQNPDLDLVLADLKMPGMDGLELFRRLGERGQSPPFVIMTAFGTVRTAVQALKEGVTDYLIKPLDYDELTIILDKAIAQHQMSLELKELRQQVREERGFHELIGASPEMTEVFEMVRTVGPTGASVLITGETGTGKELVARALHAESPRHDQAMVAVNCAALTESLLEAELFGYVKGAFTGAVADKKGRLELADNGTLFLDEIGHMTLSLQAKLLRFLQEMTFEPVGGTKSHRVDVRLIAATNTNLKDKIEAGQFLSDLLYRIEVIGINLPPLRRRREDVPLLVEHFVSHYARQYDKPVEGVSSEAMGLIMDHAWPGNVRELKNCLARAVILSKGRRLSLDDLPAAMLADAGRRPLKGRAGLIEDLPEDGVKLKDMEVELIKKTLVKCRGNKSLAARYLGISRKGLYEKLDRYGISHDYANGDA